MNENREIVLKKTPFEQNITLREKIRGMVEFINSKLRLKEEDFLNQRPDIYSKEEYKEEQEETKKYQDGWQIDDEHEKYIKELSSDFEVAILHTISKNNFLGKNSDVIFPTIRDDIKAGIDGIIVFTEKEKKQSLGLGIDVTFSGKEDNLRNKMESIKECIRQGILPTAKYYKDPKTGEMKKLSMPKVIIGCQQSTAEDFVNLWGSEGKDKDEKLKNHYLQALIILEVLLQVRYFSDYARRRANGEEKRKGNQEIIDKLNNIKDAYNDMNEIIYDIYLQRKNMIKEYHDLIKGNNADKKGDIVYENILNIIMIDDKELL